MSITAYLLALALFVSMPAPQGTNEWLYAQAGNGLLIYDPETGDLLQSSYFPALVLNKGLVYDSGRLYMMNQNAPFLRDFMVELHPATSRYTDIGKTDLSLWWAYVTLVRDPTTDRYYVQAADETYEADMETGKLTYLGRLEQGVAIITAIAINSCGEVYGVSPPSVYYPKAALYRLQLETGRLDRVGDLEPIPILFKTLAFDSQDRLWGAGYGPFTQQKHRLYRIDLESLELHPTFPFPKEFPGVSAIAFGPKPDVTGFCEAKTNSQGCEPSIAWKGHPSSTAHFGFEVNCSQVVVDSPGFLMLGFGGQAALPFQGGTLCVGKPIVRTTPQSSGGSAGCDGAWSLDVNTWLFTNLPLEPGDRFTCQWWGRDPGLVGRNSGQLSDALEVVLLP
jgi:hypothetical protein